MVIKDLCYKQMNDIKINNWSTYYFAHNDNEHKIYYNGFGTVY